MPTPLSPEDPRVQAKIWQLYRDYFDVAERKRRWNLRTDIPCRACHVINDWEHPDPKHAKKRHIEPFAPSANPKRLSDPRYVETFLKLNCMLLLNRECTTMEKGDVLSYLMAIEGGSQGDLLNVGKK